VDAVGIGGGYLLVLLIEAPHSLHTHSRSSSYIYSVIQNLLLWLVVIRMQPHTCNGKDYDYVYVSYLISDTNQHTVMTVEGTDHFRLDLTLLLYI
jgi:hypothetical protein